MLINVSLITEFSMDLEHYETHDTVKENTEGKKKDTHMVTAGCNLRFLKGEKHKNRC